MDIHYRNDIQVMALEKINYHYLQESEKYALIDRVAVIWCNFLNHVEDSDIELMGGKENIASLLIKLCK
jgi:hypothetical protein